MKKEDLDVARHELIGLVVSVESRCAALNGTTGMVVDETKHILVVERASGSEAAVPKSGQRFLFRDGDKRFAISGDEILFRPEDRTKKVRG